MALGLNLAAGAVLGAILASGLEPGGLGLRWTVWLWPAGLGAVLGTLAFRFPRSVGLPLLLLVGTGGLLVVQALKEFQPLGPGFSAPLVQPLTDRETVTVFALRADLLEVPEGVPLVPATLYRLRPGSSDPAEWWWSWAVSRGWARSSGAALPAKPLKFGLYRLSLVDGNPVWNLEAPELTVPEGAPGP